MLMLLLMVGGVDVVEAVVVDSVAVAIDVALFPYREARK